MTHGTNYSSDTRMYSDLHSLMVQNKLLKSELLPKLAAKTCLQQGPLPATSPVNKPQVYETCPGKRMFCLTCNYIGKKSFKSSPHPKTFFLFRMIYSTFMKSRRYLKGYDSVPGQGKVPGRDGQALREEGAQHKPLSKEKRLC